MNTGTKLGIALGGAAIAVIVANKIRESKGAPPPDQIEPEEPSGVLGAPPVPPAMPSTIRSLDLSERAVMDDPWRSRVTAMLISDLNAANAPAGDDWYWRAVRFLVTKEPGFVVPSSMSRDQALQFLAQKVDSYTRSIRPAGAVDDYSTGTKVAMAGLVGVFFWFAYSTSVQAQEESSQRLAEARRAYELHQRGLRA
jgi:hypothetical protein